MRADAPHMPPSASSARGHIPPKRSRRLGVGGKAEALPPTHRILGSVGPQNALFMDIPQMPGP